MAAGKQIAASDGADAEAAAKVAAKPLIGVESGICLYTRSLGIYRDLWPGAGWTDTA